MEHYFLTNKKIRLRINKKGAELASLENLENNYEYIWNADSKVWNRHAPHLFPIVGKLKDDTYYYEGKAYKMSQHGFARDKEFEMIDQTSGKISFRLRFDDHTYQVYPFRFEFFVHYSMEENTVKVSYEVVNHDEKIMFFSIGAHPGFTCPLQKNESFADYFIEFEKTENLDRHLVRGGNFTGEKEKIMDDTHILHLDYDLFKKDAIVLKEVMSDYLILKSRKGPHGLKFNFEEFPYLGIWTKGEGAHFICIEPWFGIADNVDSDQKIEHKEGIRRLNPEEKFTCSYSFEIF